MKAEQLTFDLTSRPALGREDFLVAESNQAAIRLIDSWPEWSNNIAILHGAGSSGKSHILTVWKARSGACDLSDVALKPENFSYSETDIQAVVIDDLDRILEQGGSETQNFMFHLMNAIQQKKGFLLATTRKPPSEWNISLKDLESRLKAAQIVEISSPDDALLMGLFIKLAHDRQLTIDPDVVQFIVTRSERRFENIFEAVKKIDAASLQEKRRITLPFVKKILGL